MKDMFKYNMNLYNKMFQGVANYYKDYTKFIQKGMMDLEGLNDHEYRKGTYPANGHEIYNYVARYSMSNLQIQAVLKFDERLDFDKLKQAVRLSIEQEPILGCRFIEDNRPYWKPLENFGMLNFCTFEETDDTEQAILKFIKSPIDLDKDPMVNVKLIRSKWYDILGLKINHAFCDGVGVQEYINLLAKIYSSIDNENRSFIPEPRIGGRKDQDRLFKDLGITNPESIFIPGSDIYTPTWPFPWEESGSNIPCMSILRLPSGHLDEITKYSKSKGATVNDYILTAFYRAMLDMGHPIYGTPMEIPITVDLRRYLSDHKTQAIRNFSGSVNTKQIMFINEPFSRNLKRTSLIMREVKKGNPGLQSAIGLERIEKINFRETLAYYKASGDPKSAKDFCPLYRGDKCVPTLSNLGYLSRTPIKFGSITVIDAFILPPVIRAPGLLLMASSYNSVLTLAIGYYKSTISKENIDKLLERIKNELIQGYKS